MASQISQNMLLLLDFGMFSISILFINYINQICFKLKGQVDGTKDFFIEVPTVVSD